MDLAFLCLCGFPPIIGGLVIAISHLRQRAWWRAVLWTLIPFALLVAGLAGGNKQPGAAMLCLASAALMVTVGLVVELRSRRKLTSGDMPEPVKG